MSKPRAPLERDLRFAAIDSVSVTTASFIDFSHLSVRLTARIAPDFLKQQTTRAPRSNRWDRLLDQNA
jgi:hypothetical protein